MPTVWIGKTVDSDGDAELGMLASSVSIPGLPADNFDVVIVDACHSEHLGVNPVLRERQMQG